jgi:hypothetical protein
MQKEQREMKRGRTISTRRMTRSWRMTTTTRRRIALLPPLPPPPLLLSLPLLQLPPPQTVMPAPSILPLLKQWQ